MRKKSGGAWRAAAVYAGVILGAGFASGQELVLYFTRFGMMGLVGLVVMGLVLALGGWAVLDICVRRKLDNASAFMQSLFGKRLGAAISTAVSLFIGVVFCTMHAGGGAFAHELFGLPFTAGAAAVAVVCFVVFLFDLRGVVRLNMIVAPLLIAGGVFFGLYTAANRHIPAFQNQLLPRLSNNWIWAATAYAAYNMLTAVCVLAGLRGNGLVTDRPTARRAGLLGGGMMCALGLCFALPLLIHADALAGLELPLHRLAQNSGRAIEGFYTCLLAAAIVSSAVSNGFVVVEWLQKRLRLHPVIIKAAVALIGAVAAHAGFSVFVSQVYPLFSVLGVFALVVILLAFVFGRKTDMQNPAG